MSPEELDAFVSVLQLAGNKLGQRNTLERKPREETEKVPSVDKSISDLEGMGVRIYGLDEPVGISHMVILHFWSICSCRICLHISISL